MSQVAWDTLVQKHEQARGHFFASLGDAENKITPLVSYSLQGFPAWPVRDCWQIVQRPNTTLIFTDGLSDPYEDGSPSIGLEVCVEAAPRLPDFDAVVNSWAYQLLFQASFNVASSPSLRSALEGRNSSTIEFYDVKAPSTYISERETVGALLTVGGHNVPDRILLPDGDALVLVVTPLLAKELDAVCSPNRDKALDKLLTELPKRGYHHYCHDNRPSVI